MDNYDLRKRIIETDYTDEINYYDIMEELESIPNIGDIYDEMLIERVVIPYFYKGCHGDVYNLDGTLHYTYDLVDCEPESIFIDYYIDIIRLDAICEKIIVMFDKDDNVKVGYMD